MTALNSRRLGLGHSVWRPLTIGIGSLALDLLVTAYFPYLIIDVILYGGAVGLIWFLELRPQREAFLRFRQRPSAAIAIWLWPSVAGAPLALVGFLVFVMGPLYELTRALEPAEVCEKFNKGATAQEMADYSTVNLAAARDTLATLPKENGLRDFEMTGKEKQAPPEIGGYLVGMRGWPLWSGRRTQVEAFYHLLSRNNQWKVEDIYIVPWDRQAVEVEVALSARYDLLKPSIGSAPAQPAPEPSGKIGTTKLAQGMGPTTSKPVSVSGTNTTTLKWLGGATGLGTLAMLARAALLSWWYGRKEAAAKS